MSGLIARGYARLSALAASGGAALVGFIQSGVGAVSRWVQDKLRENVSLADFGAVGNGVSDDTAALQAAVNMCATGKKLNLGGKEKNYLINGTISVPESSGLYIYGEGARISSNKEILFRLDGNASSLTIDGIEMSTTHVSAAGSSGMITSENKAITDFVVNRCKFSNPTSHANAIKLVQDSAVLNGLKITGNRFQGVGRMAVEVINHVYDAVERYKNVEISGNVFDGCGEASIYGMAVSLSGEGTHCTITENKIQGTKDIAIEAVGTHNYVIDKNTLSNLKTGCDSISTGQGSVLTAPYGASITNNLMQNLDGGFFQPTVLKDSVISGNIVLGGNHKISIESVDGLVISGNVFKTSAAVLLKTLKKCVSSNNVYESTGTTVGSVPELLNSTENTFSGDVFRSAYARALLVAGTSANNIFSGATFDNSPSTVAGACLQFDGASVTGNVAVACNFKRTAAGGLTWQQVTSASSNQVYLPSYNTLNLLSTDIYTTKLGVLTGSNAWRTPIQLGSGFIWTDSTGKLRIKTSQPASDADGTVVGAQT